MSFTPWRLTFVSSLLALGLLPSPSRAISSPPRYLTVTYQVAVNGRLFSGKVQGQRYSWIMAENQPLQQLGVHLPGPTGCVDDSARAPVLLIPQVDAQLYFMPARDNGKRVVVDGSQVWEGRLTVEVMTGYDERDDGGCRRFWPHIEDRVARVRLFEGNSGTYVLTVPNIPGWSNLTASLQLTNEFHDRNAKWLNNTPAW